MHNRFVLAIAVTTCGLLAVAVALVAFLFYRPADGKVVDNLTAPTDGGPTALERPDLLQGPHHEAALEFRYRLDLLEQGLTDNERRLADKNDQLQQARTTNADLRNQLDELKQTLQSLLDTAVLASLPTSAEQAANLRAANLETGNSANNDSPTGVPSTVAPAEGSAGGETTVGGGEPGGSPRNQAPAAAEEELQQRLEETQLELLLLEMEFEQKQQQTASQLDQRDRSVARAFADLGTAGLAMLQEMLAHPDPQVRRWAIEMVSRIGPPAASTAGALRELTADPDEGVREAAKQALTAIRE